jgi:hypothetical protein
VQDVRQATLRLAVALGRQAAALRDPEPVLLVDDRHEQPRERHVQERVRPHRHERLSGQDPRLARPPLARGHLGGDQQDLDAERPEQLVGGPQVLDRERLRGRHQRRLSTGVEGAEERGQGDRRLARADVALQQALHRRGPLQVGVDRGQRRHLGAGQGEGQACPVRRGQRSVDRQRLGTCGGVDPAPMAEQAQLQEQELLVRQPASGQLVHAPGGGPVRRVERVPAQRAGDARRGGRSGRGRARRRGGGAPPPPRAGGPARTHGRRRGRPARDRARRVAVLRRPGRLGRVLGRGDDLVRARRDLEAAVVACPRLAAEQEQRAWLERPGEVPLVEPDRGDGPPSRRAAWRARSGGSAAGSAAPAPGRRRPAR